MKVGHRVKIINLDYYIDRQTREAVKRPKKYIGMEGIIKDIYMGVFKIELEDGTVDYFDGREIEFAGRLKERKARWVFVSWQKHGKSVYDSEEGEQLFVGDLRRGVEFTGSIELDDEEVQRIQDAAKKGIRPVFDLFIFEGEEKRKHRRELKSEEEKP